MGIVIAASTLTPYDSSKATQGVECAPVALLTERTQGRKTSYELPDRIENDAWINNERCIDGGARLLGRQQNGISKICARAQTPGAGRGGGHVYRRFSQGSCPPCRDVTFYSF